MGLMGKRTKNLFLDMKNLVRKEVRSSNGTSIIDPLPLRDMFDGSFESPWHPEVESGLRYQIHDLRSSAMVLINVIPTTVISGSKKQ